MTTLLDTLTKGAAYLDKKGVDAPRFTMELLAAHVLQMKRMELYLQFDRPIAESDLKTLRDLLKKRGERIPLQHLLGEVDFYKRAFLCDDRALIPRPETEELVEHVLALLPKDREIKVLDLCCGSGVIGLTIKAELGERAEVTLSDLSPAALGLAKDNATRLGLEVDLLQSDLFDEIEDSYDLIVCNPPYVAEGETLEAELAYDPGLALFSGSEGLDLIRKIVPQAKNFLNGGAYLALEIGYDQAETLTTLLQENGYTGVEVKKDLDKIARFPIARWE